MSLTLTLTLTLIVIAIETLTATMTIHSLTHHLSHTHTLFLPQGVVITEALGKVPLLEGLTEAQLARISDCVEMLPFSMGKLNTLLIGMSSVFMIIDELLEFI